MPPETWTPFPRDQVIDVPFFPRDSWGRDVLEAVMLGAAYDFDLTLVPAELPQRVRYDDAMYVLMTAAPPTYWREWP